MSERGDAARRQPHADEQDASGSRTPGIARRSAVALAWSTPVIAAAAGAPGAAASPTPPPQPTVDVAFVGAWITALDQESPRRFRVEARLNGYGAPGTPVLLAQDAVVRIDSWDQDVETWGPGIVPESARVGSITVRAGVYPTVASYAIDGQDVVVTAPLPSALAVCDLAADQAIGGRKAVQAAVKRGPQYFGRDIYAPGVYGRAITVEEFDY